MSQQRTPALSTPSAAARAVLAALLLIAGLLAPQVAPVPARAGTHPDDDVLRAELTADLEAYLAARGEPEHVTAVGLSVGLPGRRSTLDLSAGTTTSGGSDPVGPDSVWQVGSNTKAFTSVLLLQLEAEGRLSIDDPLGRWLPEYPQWQDVSIRRLLSMTSGIPTYDRQPAWQADYAADPTTRFSAERLVGYVADAPATSGYDYSNTNYVLAEMIVERVTGDSYADQLYDRLLDPLHLHGLHYREHLYPPAVMALQPAAYYANEPPPAWAGLVGRDVSRDSLSWARGAGGMLGTTGDMVRWERALYSGRLLPPEQQAELTSLVSTQTGQPIEQTTPDDPNGFGLGVAQATAPELGTFWVYEGATLGFRFLHVHLPELGLTVAIGLNSTVLDDQIGALALEVYDTLAGQALVPARPAPVGAPAAVRTGS